MICFCNVSRGSLSEICLSFLICRLRVADATGRSLGNAHRMHGARGVLQSGPLDEHPLAVVSHRLVHREVDHRRDAVGAHPQELGEDDEELADADELHVDVDGGGDRVHCADQQHLDEGLKG